VRSPYVYAVLHTPAYRTRYKEFLKIDFPRIPYPADAAEFRRLAEIGAQLVDVHLLRAPETRDLFAPVATFPVAGSNRIDAIRRDAARVWINPTQYFDDIPEEAWTAFVGGYQPARKWLQDRKNRTLTFDDLSHYKSLLLALLSTRRLVALLPS
jgi:predicted helicase